MANFQFFKVPESPLKELSQGHIPDALSKEWFEKRVEITLEQLRKDERDTRDDNKKADIRARIDALNVFYMQHKMAEWEGIKQEDLMGQFRDFLLGKSKWNYDRNSPITWGARKLVGKDIDIYLEAVMDSKYEFDKTYNLVCNTGKIPSNLREAWMFFCYKLKRGAKVPTDLFLKTWEAFYPSPLTTPDPNREAALPPRLTWPTQDPEIKDRLLGAQEGNYDKQYVLFPDRGNRAGGEGGALPQTTGQNGPRPPPPPPGGVTGGMPQPAQPAQPKTTPPPPQPGSGPGNDGDGGGGDDNQPPRRKDIDREGESQNDEAERELKRRTKVNQRLEEIQRQKEDVAMSDEEAMQEAAELEELRRAKAEMREDAKRAQEAVLKKVVGPNAVRKHTKANASANRAIDATNAKKEQIAADIARGVNQRVRNQLTAAQIQALSLLDGLGETAKRIASNASYLISTWKNIRGQMREEDLDDAATNLQEGINEVDSLLSLVLAGVKDKNADNLVETVRNIISEAWNDDLLAVEGIDLGEAMTLANLEKYINLIRARIEFASAEIYDLADKMAENALKKGISNFFLRTSIQNLRELAAVRARREKRKREEEEASERAAKRAADEQAAAEPMIQQATAEVDLKDMEAPPPPQTPSPPPAEIPQGLSRREEKMEDDNTDDLTGAQSSRRVEADIAMAVGEEEEEPMNVDDGEEPKFSPNQKGFRTPPDTAERLEELAERKQLIETKLAELRRNRATAQNEKPLTRFEKKKHQEEERSLLFQQANNQWMINRLQLKLDNQAAQRATRERNKARMEGRQREEKPSAGRQQSGGEQFYVRRPGEKVAPQKVPSAGLQKVDRQEKERLGAAFSYYLYKFASKDGSSDKGKRGLAKAAAALRDLEPSLSDKQATEEVIAAARTLEPEYKRTRQDNQTFSEWLETKATTSKQRLMGTKAGSKRGKHLGELKKKKSS